MPNIEILDILMINCNTIDTREAGKAAKCSTNTANGQGLGCQQHYTNRRQEDDGLVKCYTNTVSNSNSKSNNLDKPAVNNKETISFQGQTERMTREQPLKSHNSYKEIFKMYLME